MSTIIGYSSADCILFAFDEETFLLPDAAKIFEALLRSPASALAEGKESVFREH